MADFDILKELLNSDEWPNAVEPYMICGKDSESDKMQRAEAIIRIIIQMPINGVRFLDFGCGEGHVVKLASEVCQATGFDVQEYPWDRTKGFYSTSWEEVRDRGPYDVILVYDVIDHALIKGPDACVKSIQPLLAPGGKAYVRCHPWTSKHSTHLYYNVNKSYMHLVFNDEELAQLGCVNMHTHRVFHPIISYKSWFDLAGLRIVSSAIVEDSIPPLMSNHPLIAERIKAHWRTSHEPELASGRAFPGFQLRQQFHDYVLTV